jgi:hypothetical protein
VCNLYTDEGFRFVIDIFTFVRAEVFMAVTMKNAVFWNIKTQFIPHRSHKSPLQSQAGYVYVRFEVFTA